MKKITREERTLVLFMLIGDGTLSKDGRFQIKHSVHQKEYLEWKRSLLSKFIRISECTKKIDRVTYKGQTKEHLAFYIRTRQERFLKLYRKVLYPQGDKKVYTRKILKKLTPLGLAIWYMDDGSLSQIRDKNGKVQTNQLTLNTYCSKEECQVLIDYFKEMWKIRFGMYKHRGKYYIRCNTVQAREFVKIVYPYVSQVPCMIYKLNVKPMTERSYVVGELRECRTHQVVGKQKAPRTGEDMT